MCNLLTIKKTVAFCAVLWTGSAMNSGAAELAATGPDARHITRVDSQDLWGTLCGRFVLRPDDSERPFDEALVIDPATGGIKNILVYARKVSRVRPLNISESAGGSRPASLEIKAHAFNPRVVVLQQCQHLTIRNDDKVPHVFLMRPPVGMETNLLLNPGDYIERQLCDRNFLPVIVSCSFHPWMTTYVLVRDDPYFAVTDRYGRFEIRDLPAAEEIEFQVWHELGRGRHGSIEARPEWGQGRFRITIPRNHTVDLGTIVLTPASLHLEKRHDAGNRAHDAAPH